MENITVSNSTGTNGIICASVVQYGHGFLRGDNVFNSALAYLLFQIVVVTTASRLLGKQALVYRLNFNKYISIWLKKVKIISSSDSDHQVLMLHAGRLLVFIKEPLVIAEMIVGIVLGPTVMGRIPGWSDTLFPCHSVRYLKLISSFGLVLFMFVVGVEIDIQYLRKRGKHAIIASVVSCSLCFVFAVPLMFLLHKKEYANDTGKQIFLSLYRSQSMPSVISCSDPNRLGCVLYLSWNCNGNFRTSSSCSHSLRVQASRISTW